ncbi:unnamed protein product [Chrysoparadoxa australica]
MYTTSLLALGAIAAGAHQYSKGGGGQSSAAESKGERPSDFNAFQRSFLVVALMAMFSDWLQGPYVYALYSYYGFQPDEIAQLFVAGFLSSMLVGTFVGSLADKYGRRRMCSAFALFYFVGCCTKLVNSYPILLLGRIFCGVATSLLFSVFESWMVCEHTKSEYPAALLSETFSLLTFWNGVVAVVAGLVANLFVSIAKTPVAPFILAMIPLTFVGLAVQSWPENHGDRDANVRVTFQNAWNHLLADTRIVYLGLAQGCFEGAMYIFVFMWTPALQAAKGSDEAELGTVFACFMVAVMLGSAIFSSLVGRHQVDCHRIPQFLHAMAVAASAMSYVFITDTTMLFLSFLLFEISVGIFYPAYGTIKSAHIPEEVRAAIMNYFRVPLNAFVALVLTQITSYDPSIAFGITTAMNVLSMALYLKANALFQDDQGKQEVPYDLV